MLLSLKKYKMIRKIRFKNFYSFRKESEINFLATNKSDYSYYNSPKGEYITKVGAFIGANASGKTNVMRLLSFLSYFVCAGSKKNSVSDNSIEFKTFFDNNKPSYFNLEFEYKNKIYYYDLVVNDNTVKEEKLTVKGVEKYSKPIEIFERKFENILHLHKDYFKGFSKKFTKNIRLDVSLIGFLKAHYNIDVINEVYDYFDSFESNINELGEINNTHHKIKAVLKYLENEELKVSMEKVVRNFDLGLKGFNIDKEGSKLTIEGLHKKKDGENRLPFNYESRGTRSLFYVLANILTAIKTGSVVVIDEIESGFHPDALKKLLNYFIDENAESNAQILFSSHSLQFLNKLDMHQIYLIEKGEDCESGVYRLNEVEGVRSDENFLRKYMAGAYGGFPQIRI